MQESACFHCLMRFDDLCLTVWEGITIDLTLLCNFLIDNNWSLNYFVFNQKDIMLNYLSRM